MRVAYRDEPSIPAGGGEPAKGQQVSRPYRELLIGCGSRRDKFVPLPHNPGWRNLTTLDLNADHEPDVVADLMQLPLPFEDETFDEIHAYEVLEHTGAQGDYLWFFAQFSDFWRLLKPGGHFAATCPAVDSRWAWGDPSHTRVLMHETLTFLVQPEYTKQVGRTAMSDFRHIYKADFDVPFSRTEDGVFAFCLQAVKPSRIEVHG